MFFFSHFLALYWMFIRIYVYIYTHPTTIFASATLKMLPLALSQYEKRRFHFLHNTSITFFCLLFLQCSLFIAIVYIKNENGRICSWNANNKNNECVHYLLISINRNKEREKSKAKNYLSVYIKTNTAYLSEWEELIVGKFMARIVFGAFLRKFMTVNCINRRGYWIQFFSIAYMFTRLL